MPCLLHWPRVHASTSLSSVVARPARPSPSASRSTLPTACPRVASAPRGASRRVGPPRPCSRRRSIEQHSVVPRVEGACSVAPRRSVRCQGRHADGRGPRRGSARRGARAEGAPSATPVRAAVSCARGLSWPAEAAVHQVCQASRQVHEHRHHGDARGSSRNPREQVRSRRGRSGRERVSCASRRPSGELAPRPERPGTGWRRRGERWARR
jgi:hypothetical protein